MVKGMKQTEIGWIPEDWKVRSLKEVTSEFKSGFSITSKLIFEDDLFPVYGGNGMRGYTSRFTHEGEYVLIGRQGALCGNLNFVEGKIFISEHAVAVKSNENSETKYLYYAIEPLNLNSLSESSAQPGLSVEKIVRLKIPLPPLPEQEAIARALSDADAWIESLEQLIAKKRLIKQGAMQELLTQKEGWEVKKLGDFCEIIMGQSPLSEFYNSSGNGLPLVQGNADIENRKTIVRNYTSSITKKGKTGDIIMSVRAPVGEIARATFDCCLGRGVCAFRTENDFLYHLLIYKESSWAQFSTGSTFDSVNSNQIKELEIFIPKSLPEQTRIATILSDMDAELEALEQQLHKARQIKQGMMQELLTGRVRLV